MAADRKVLHSSANWSDFKGTYMRLDELRLKLSDCIRQYSITKFDADDIVELISEGESIEWIVNQLKGDAQIDVDAVTSLLTEIKDQVGAKGRAGDNKSAEPAIDPGIPAGVSNRSVSIGSVANRPYAAGRHGNASGHGCEKNQGVDGIASRQSHGGFRLSSAVKKASI